MTPCSISIKCTLKTKVSTGKKPEEANFTSVKQHYLIHIFGSENRLGFGKIYMLFYNYGFYIASTNIL